MQDKIPILEEDVKTDLSKYTLSDMCDREKKYYEKRKAKTSHTPNENEKNYFKKLVEMERLDEGMDMESILYRLISATSTTSTYNKIPIEISINQAKNVWHQCVRYLEKIECTSQKEYKYQKYNTSVITQIIMWSLNHPNCELDLKKGILLIGDVGRGKSMIMRTFQLYLNVLKAQSLWFQMASCKKIGIELRGKKNLSEHISLYTQKTYCFDDLGYEKTEKIYGNDIQVMEEILSIRYDMFITLGCITHGTSNETIPTLGEIYGNRMESRLNQMFNEVVLLGDMDYRNPQKA